MLSILFSLLFDSYFSLFYLRFSCDIPDEFIFSQFATLAELTLAVQHGGLTVKQKALLDSPPDNADGRSTAIIDHQKQPLCPWFTCCY
jgi:hypothetical protein